MGKTNPGYQIACDDADPETTCRFSAEGSSVDEAFQKMWAHARQHHAAKLARLNKDQIAQLESKIKEILSNKAQLRTHEDEGFADPNKRVPAKSAQNS